MVSDFGRNFKSASLRTILHSQKFGFMVEAEYLQTPAPLF
jgi:hypothetical protein